jgi:MFS family permease
MTLPADPPPPSVLREPLFVRFWIARLSTTIALTMQAAAVGWQMYDLTRDPFDLGLVGLVQFVPSFLLVLVAGHFADRHDRRRIIAAAQGVAGFASALLTVGAVGGFLSREWLLAAVFVVGVARAFEAPTLSAFLPALVPPNLLARAVAASSTAGQTGMIAGPAIGGLLYLISPILVYALCCMLFLAASVTIFSLRVKPHETTRQPVTLERLFAGIAFIRHHPIVLGAIMLDLFAVLIGSVLALLPIFARDVLATGPGGFGLLRAAPAAGALIVSALLVHVSFNRRVGHLIFAGVAVFGLATIVFSLSTSLIVSALALVVVGGADMISVVARQTLIQLHTPDEMRGRVSAVNSMFVVGSNQLGDFRAGTVARLFDEIGRLAGATAFVGAVPAALIGGIGTLLVVAACWRIFPELTRVDRLDAQAVPPDDTTRGSGPSPPPTI